MITKTSRYNLKFQAFKDVFRYYFNLLYLILSDSQKKSKVLKSLFLEIIKRKRLEKDSWEYLWFKRTLKNRTQGDETYKSLFHDSLKLIFEDMRFQKKRNEEEKMGYSAFQNERFKTQGYQKQNLLGIDKPFQIMIYLLLNKDVKLDLFKGWVSKKQKLGEL